MNKKIKAAFEEKNPGYFDAHKGRCTTCFNYGPVLNHGDILFIGSFTSPEGLLRGFYYTSSNNHFWKLIDNMLGFEDKQGPFTSLKNALKEILNIGGEPILINGKSKNREDIQDEFYKNLEKYHIAICDIFKICSFSEPWSSRDSKIEVKNCKLYSPDIKNWINTYGLDNVYVNGKLTASICKKSVIQLNLSHILQTPCQFDHQKYKQRLSDWNSKVGDKLRKLNGIDIKDYLTIYNNIP